MTFTVAVAGASGYAGGETLRLLAQHPQARIGTLTANSSAGEQIGSHHPHLISLAERVMQPTTAEALAGHDVIILALPHGASGPITAALERSSPNSVLIDLGADHRLTDPQAWADYYGGEYAGAWVYGMPELLTGWDAAVAGPTRQRTQLVGARRIAVPGCNVTAVTLALAPGIAAGTLLPRDLVAVLACGVSGAGKGLKPHLQAAEILGAATPYAVGGSHRHIPEIIQNLGQSTSISFTPTLVPMPRGILATVTALPGPAFDAERLSAPWEAAYSQEPFVRLLPQGVWPSTAQTLGANTALIQVAFDHRAGRVVVVAAIDNLVKGTAGATIQCLNLALGLPEGMGLTQNAVAP